MGSHADFQQVIESEMQEKSGKNLELYLHVSRTETLGMIESDLGQHLTKKLNPGKYSV